MPTETLSRQLTSIKNLLGRQGGHFLIFGLLTRLQDGALYLEDLDDKVELDLSDAVRALSSSQENIEADAAGIVEQTPESGLFTEGSFVLVDGDYTADSVFRVHEMGHPPSERRSDARWVKSSCSSETLWTDLAGSSRKVFGHHDFLGLGAMSLSEEVRPCLGSHMLSDG